MHAGRSDNTDMIHVVSMYTLYTLVDCVSVHIATYWLNLYILLHDGTHCHKLHALVQNHCIPMQTS